MKTWKRIKRKLRRWLHPSECTLRAAIRLGRMLERKEARQEAQKPLPPIFGGYPVYIAVPQQAATLAAYSPPEAYHQLLQERLACARHSTSMIRKTILAPLDGPPPEDQTLHEIPAWIV